ncbi:MAG: UDP-3-O-(3-hydroxymyristoyl)glucosamine N-acyltransferase, partial [Alcanivoracaceae bacterium]
NVVIGDHTAIAGKAGIAGSARVGRNCVIAGAVGIAGHLDICDGVQIMAMSLVSRSIDEPGVYASGQPVDQHANWRKNTVRIRQLDDLFRRVKRLEKCSQDNGDTER